MRFLKPLLIGAIGVFIVILGISLVLPGQVMTSKWVMVAAEKDTILNEIRDLSKWPEWNLLLKDVKSLEIGQKPALTDTGSRISWVDGRGAPNSLVVTGNNEKGIVTEMRVNHKNPITSGFSVEKRQADSVQVVWFIVENLRWYPWEKFYGMMAQDMKGPLMQESLEGLRRKMQEGRR